MSKHFNQDGSVGENLEMSNNRPTHLETQAANMLPGQRRRKITHTQGQHMETTTFLNNLVEKSPVRPQCQMWRHQHVLPEHSGGGGSRAVSQQDTHYVCSKPELLEDCVSKDSLGYN